MNNLVMIKSNIKSKADKVVRVEGNSVIFINREILPGPEDVHICFTFF